VLSQGTYTLWRDAPFKSATSALHIASLALGLWPDDLLWTSPITSWLRPTVAPILNVSDIEPESGVISLKALVSRLETAERQIRLPLVLITAHLCPTSCPMQLIAELVDC